MRGLGLTLLFLAGTATPVAAKNDEVDRLMAPLKPGVLRARGAMRIVPILRSPGAVPMDKLPQAPSWRAATLRAEPVLLDGSRFIRIRNQAADSLFVPAGSVFGGAEGEWVAKRGAVVPPAFSVLLPAERFEQPVPGPASFQMVLPPRVARAFHYGEGISHDATRKQWDGFFGSSRLAVLKHLTVVQTARAQVNQLCKGLLSGKTENAVGFMLIMGNKVEVVHIFDSPALFRAVLPSILDGIAVEVAAWLVVTKGKVGGMIQNHAHAVYQAQRLLQLIKGAKRKRVESYGAGFELEIQSPELFGAALVTHENRVTHLHVTARKVLVPPSMKKPGGGGGGGGKGGGGADGGGSGKEGPGTTVRKPRPTLAEKRQHDRTRGASGAARGTPRSPTGTRAGSSGGGGGRSGVR